LLGLLTSVSAQVYASGLVLNDNELRNDLSWLSDRELSSLAFRPGPEPGRDYPGVKAKPPILLNRWCWRVLISAFLIKADFRVSGYTSTDQPGTRRVLHSQPADNSLSLAFNNSGDWWDVHLQGNVEGGERISNGSRSMPTARTAR
jgi:hypothetical protein